MAISGLNILAKKHYSINKEAIDTYLNIIQNNILNEQSLKKLSEALNLIFDQNNVEKSTFNKLFNLMINNNQLIEQLSPCLASSLKFKNDEYIKSLISENISNIEYLIQNNFINEHVVNLIKSVPTDFYKEKDKIIISIFILKKINKNFLFHYFNNKKTYQKK